MIGDKFDFNGKQYEIKRDVSFGEYKKISRISSSLQNLAKDYTTADDEQKSQLEKEFAKTTDDQLLVIGNFLESMLGLTQIDIDNMSLVNAITLFNEAFTVSTQVKKKSEITLESQSSQTTQEIQHS